MPSAQGLCVRAETQWPALTPDDLVIVPGWHSDSGGFTSGLSAARIGQLAAQHGAGGTVANV